MSDEEIEENLFREAMSDVRPLPEASAKVAPERVARGPTPQQLERREAALGNRPTAREQTDPNFLTLGEVPGVGPRDVLAWKKDGVQNEVFRRLKSGRYPIEGTLDLHRLTVREARTEVFRFYQLALRKGWRTLLISHGRGERSSTPARIKSYVAQWLGQIPEVIAYHSATQQHGGSGAVYVLLRKSAAARQVAREAHGLRGALPEDERPGSGDTSVRG
ncbi:MAG: DNA endonuclease SmrA [Pseudomonadales bacterium]